KPVFPLFGQFPTFCFSVLAATMDAFSWAEVRDVARAFVSASDAGPRRRGLCDDKRLESRRSRRRLETAVSGAM
ncbi:hypothetical protein OF83DRAFT_1121142, partial [Amylostereum chailletii]